MGVRCRRCAHVSLSGGSASMRRPTSPGCGAAGLAGRPATRRRSRRGRPGGGDPRGCGDQLNRTGSNRTGSNRTGSNRTGSNRTGSNRTGSNRTGSNRTGSNRTGSNRTGVNRTGARATAVLPNGADPAGRSNHAVADCALVCRARVWSVVPSAAPLCLRFQYRGSHTPHRRPVRQQWLCAGPTVFAMPVNGPGAFCDTSGTGAIRCRGRSGCERGDAEASVAT